MKKYINEYWQSTEWAKLSIVSSIRVVGKPKEVFNYSADTFTIYLN